jgi:hypothetical protein
MKINIVFFCVMLPCNLVDRYNVLKEPTISVLYLKDGGSIFPRKMLVSIYKDTGRHNSENRSMNRLVKMQVTYYTLSEFYPLLHEMFTKSTNISNKMCIP